MEIYWQSQLILSRFFHMLNMFIRYVYFKIQKKI